MEVGLNCVCDVGVGLVHVTGGACVGRLEDRYVGRTLCAAPLLRRDLSNTSRLSRFRVMRVLVREHCTHADANSIPNLLLSSPIIEPFNIVKSHYVT